MSDFIDTFIDVGSVGKHVHLVKALIELIITDESIANSDLFYIASNGSPVTKADFHGLTDICLHSFLLGIWHFIIVERKDNKIGRATYETWHIAPTTQGATWTYCACIGDAITTPINVSTILDTQARKCCDDTVDYNTENEPYVGYSEPFIEEPNPEPTPHTVTQIVNTPAIFINHGENGIQINNTGTLNIDRGKKSE